MRGLRQNHSAQPPHPALRATFSRREKGSRNFRRFHTAGRKASAAALAASGERAAPASARPTAPVPKKLSWRRLRGAADRERDGDRGAKVGDGLPPNSAGGVEDALSVESGRDVLAMVRPAPIRLTQTSTTYRRSGEPRRRPPDQTLRPGAFVQRRLAERRHCARSGRSANYSRPEIVCFLSVRPEELVAALGMTLGA